jgi:hypothetical protein
MENKKSPVLLSSSSPRACVAIWSTLLPRLALGQPQQAGLGVVQDLALPGGASNHAHAVFARGAIGHGHTTLAHGLEHGAVDGAVDLGFGLAQIESALAGGGANVGGSAGLVARHRAFGQTPGELFGVDAVDVVVGLGLAHEQVDDVRGVLRVGVERSAVDVRAGREELAGDRVCVAGAKAQGARQLRLGNPVHERVAQVAVAGRVAHAAHGVDALFGVARLHGVIEAADEHALAAELHLLHFFAELGVAQGLAAALLLEQAHAGHGLLERVVPGAGRAVCHVFEVCRPLGVHEVQDGPHLALAVGQRLGLAEGVLDDVALVVALEGLLPQVPGAGAIDVLRLEGAHALVVDGALRTEEAVLVHHGQRDGVAAGGAQRRAVVVFEDDSVGVLARLEVALGHLHERQASLDLAGRAAEIAERVVAADGVGRDDEGRRDVDVVALEDGRIGRLGVALPHVARADALVAQAAPAGLAEQVGGPVHAHVLALIPGAVHRVLFEDVGFFAGDRVVLPTNVDVALDGEGCNDAAVLVAGVQDVGVVAVRKQRVGGDAPLDAAHVRGRTDEARGLRSRHVGDAGAEVPDIAGIDEATTVVGVHEVGLGHETILHAVDRVALLGATLRAA